MSDTTPTRIVGGIEWYTYEVRTPDATWQEEDAQCARCGSSATWTDCENCGGEGECECWEEDPLWYDEGATRGCDWCRGRGGRYACISGRRWCEENPMPGRKHIESTALQYESEHE